MRPERVVDARHHDPLEQAKAICKVHRSYGVHTYILGICNRKSDPARRMCPNAARNQHSMSSLIPASGSTPQKTISSRPSPVFRSVSPNESRDCERPSVDQPTLSAESLCPLRADHLTLCPRGSVGSSQIYQQIVVEPLNSLDTVERIRIFQTGSEISDRGAERLSLIWIYFRSSGGSGPTGGPLIRKRNPRGCTAKGKRGGEYRPLREMACCSLGTVG
jgi:hypothetical protein